MKSQLVNFEADRIAKEKKEAEERKRIEVEEALAEEPNSDFSDWNFSNCLGDKIDFSNYSNDKVWDFSDWDFSNCLGDRIDFSNCSSDKVFNYSKIFAKGKTKTNKT